MNTLKLSVARFVAVVVVGAAAATSVLAEWNRERYLTTVDEADAQRIVAQINRGEVQNWKNAQFMRDAESGTSPRFHIFADKLTPDQPKDPRDPQPPVVGDGQVVNGALTPNGPGGKGIARHTFQLPPGARYIVEVRSGSGATRQDPANPGRHIPLAGFIDPVVLVEDGAGSRIDANDDINWPVNCNSRVTITVPTSGTVRVVVSSYNTGESGPYTVQVRQ